jgi:glycopeptide antibiotics resistance protein
MATTDNLLWKKSFRALQWCGAIIYSFAVIYLVFLSSRRDLIMERHRNLRPVKGMLQRYHELVNADAPAIAAFYENLYGNIALFIPLPIILLALIGFRSRLLTLLVCVGISAGIELIQYVLVVGIADSDDVILNSAGSVIGILLYTVYEKLFNRKTAVA